MSGPFMVPNDKQYYYVLEICKNFTELEIFDYHYQVTDYHDDYLDLQDEETEKDALVGHGLFLKK